MVGWGPEIDPLPMDGPEPPIGEYDRGPKEKDKPPITRFIAKVFIWLFKIPLIIIKYIISVFRTPIKDYPDDTWKGGGPEGPSSYNAPPPAG